MAPTIRQIVSAVSYQNSLRDAPEIASRHLDVPDSIYSAVPELKTSPVVVLNHNGQETQVKRVKNFISRELYNANH